MDPGVLGALIGGIATVCASLIALVGVIIVSRPRQSDPPPREPAPPEAGQEPEPGENTRPPAAPPRRRLEWNRRTLGVTAFATAAIVGIAGTVLLILSRPPSCDKRTSFAFLSSIEKDLLLVDLANKYNAENDRCATVTVLPVASGTAMQKLVGDDWADTGGRRPQAWMPSSSLWSSLLGNNPKAKIKPVGKITSVAQSPLVIAMPEAIAKELGWPGRKFGWKDVLEFARNPAAWDQHQKPGWTQQFILAKENPETSTSAFGATIASYYAAVSEVKGELRPGGLTAKDVNDDGVFKYVRDVESSLQYKQDNMMLVLKELGAQDAQDKALSYLSGILMQEELVYLYNSGDPEVFVSRAGPGRKQPLHIFYPSDGPIMMDHPFVLLSTADQEQRAVAKDFSKFLLQSEQQRSFRERGFRGHDGKLFPNEVRAELRIPPDGPEDPMPIPEPGVLQTIYDRAGTLRRRARILLVVDSSGSMGEQIPNTVDSEQTGLKLVKDEVRDKLLHQLDDDDELGVWSFSDTHKEILPLTNGHVLKADRKNLNRRISGIVPKGNTSLYATVRDATAFLTRAKEKDTSGDDWVSVVIVLSDGYDTGPASFGLKQLGTVLRGQELLSSHVYTIAYGVTDREKVSALQFISDNGNGTYYNAKKNPVDLSKVFIEVFSNL